MKNIKFYISLMTVLLFVTSCFKSEEEQMQDFQEGATLANVTPVSTVYIISDLENSSTAFTIDVEGEFQEIIVYANHIRTNTIGIIATYTEVPSDTVRLSTADVLEPLGMSLSDLESTDEIYININVVTPSGLEAGSGTSAYKTVVACPSDIAGTYNVLASGSSTDPGPSADENPISGFEYQVTLTAINGYQYTISDFSGGLFTLWYDIYNLSGDYPGTIQDLCGALSYTGTSGPFGSPIAGSGSYDKETGVIKLSGEATAWGDVWTLTLTPVE
ncbi:MAG: hypothetical protein GVY19_07150 [Bacteroidetes bacterium]|jgi:hypothetical protein|nr:hypothetical protein [Bacteroidota bacterium]